MMCATFHTVSEKHICYFEYFKYRLVQCFISVLSWDTVEKHWSSFISTM